MKRGNWTDNNCYYVSVVDGKKFALLAGPFKTHKEALNMVHDATEEAHKHDNKAIWYSYGTVKMETGHSEGILNKYLNI